ncbi:MAG: glycosyltransferase [Acidimicrobiales bacterium]
MEPCLSVVVPCYNEVGTVEALLARVLAAPATHEVIVVDDGSTDGTRRVLATVSDPRVRVFEQPFNMGKGAALRRGFAEATAPYVIVQDADLEYDPADWPALLAPLLDGRADVVYGSRFLTSGAHRVLYYWHSIGNRLLTTASNMMTNLNLSDMETCYKAFRREVIQSIDIEEDRFGFEPEITAKLARRGARIYEIGISYSGRTYADGKKIGWADGARAMYCIGRYSALGERVLEATRRRRAPLGFAEADDELAGVLHSLEDAHNYADWIGELIEPHLGEKVIEIGAGAGTLTERIARRAHVVATDPSPRLVERLRTRFADHAAVSVDQGALDEIADRHAGDTYVLVNVLEHIEQDAESLRLLRDRLPANGRVILFVPAFEALYSRFDARVGHHRRYSRRSLTMTLAAAGLAPVELRYVNSLGAPAWLVFARLLGGVPTARGPALAYDRLAVPALRRLEQRRPPAFGQSLFCVARPVPPASPPGPDVPRRRPDAAG